MITKINTEILIDAYARAQHALMSGNPILADYTIRLLITAEEYVGIREYILKNKTNFSADKAFPNDNIALKYITEKRLIPNAVSGVAFCEEMLKNEIEKGVEQYVIIGAGLDTFAYREKEILKKITVFEADEKEMQEIKKARLIRCGIEIPQNLKFAAVNFETEDFWQSLEKAGFDSKKKTFFSICTNASKNVFEKIAGDMPFGSAVVISEKITEKLLLENGFETKISLGPEDIKKKYAFGDDTAVSQSCVFALKKEKEISVAEKAVKITKAKEPTPAPAQVKKKTEPPVRKRGGTKETILKTSLRLFAERGFEAVSVRDIAGEIGITQAALYKHYTNKKDILDSIMEFMKSRTDELKSGKADKNMLTEYFKYWTKEEDAVFFRRMLTIQQYSDTEAKQLFKLYFTDGAVDYVKTLTEKNAFEVWSVIYLMINMYDSAADKEKAAETAKKYISAL